MNLLHAQRKNSLKRWLSDIQIKILFRFCTINSINIHLRFTPLKQHEFSTLDKNDWIPQTKFEFRIYNVISYVLDFLLLTKWIITDDFDIDSDLNFFSILFQSLKVIQKDVTYEKKWVKRSKKK